MATTEPSYGIPDYWLLIDEQSGELVKMKITDAEREFMQANLADGGAASRARAQAANRRQYRVRIAGDEYDATLDPDTIPTSSAPSNVEVLWANIASDDTEFHWDGDKLFRCSPAEETNG